MKMCTVCKIEKELDEFPKSSQGGKRAKCKSCRSVFQKAWYIANKEKKQAYSLLYNHGITLEEYNEKFESQEGLCFICKSDNGELMLAVDHNHETGEIRSLLCNKCNLGLGYFNDNCELLQKAANYLESYGKSTSI